MRAYLALSLFLLVCVGCELLPTKTRYRYLPTDPDTVIVRDTIIIKKHPRR